jgi:hypothetical protein
MRIALAVAFVSQVFLCGVPVLAQSVTPYVDFSNHRSFATAADRLVRDSGGALLVGTSYRAQLYYGPHGAAESSLNPVMYPPAIFRPAGDSLAGTWTDGGLRILPGFSVADIATLQVRIWDGALTST